MPKILRQNLWYFQIGREVTRCVIMIGSCIILVFLSLQMLHIRRTHVKALVKEKRRFGVEKERLDTLQKRCSRRVLVVKKNRGVPKEIQK